MVATQPHLSRNKSKFFLTNGQKVSIIYLYSKEKRMLGTHPSSVMPSGGCPKVRHHVKYRRMLFRGCKDALTESNHPNGLRVVWRHISRKKSRVHTRLSCRLSSDKLIPLSVNPYSPTFCLEQIKVVSRVGGQTLNEFIGTIKS